MADKSTVQNKVEELRKMVRYINNGIVSDFFSSLALFLSNNPDFYYNETYISDSLCDYKHFINSFKKKEKILCDVIGIIDAKALYQNLNIAGLELIIEVDDLWLMTNIEEHNKTSNFRKNASIEILKQGSTWKIGKKEMFYKFILKNGTGQEQIYYYEINIQKENDNSYESMIYTYILNIMEIFENISNRKGEDNERKQVV